MFIRLDFRQGLAKWDARSIRAGDDDSIGFQLIADEHNKTSDTQVR